jgi:hypothetical protein
LFFWSYGLLVSKNCFEWDCFDSAIVSAIYEFLSGKNVFMVKGFFFGSSPFLRGG